MSLYTDTLKMGMDPAELGITPDTPYPPGYDPTTGVPTGGSTTAGTGTSGGGTTAVTNLPTDSLAMIKSTLTGWGFAPADVESLGTYAWDKIVHGIPSEQIMLDIARERPEYQARFPAMKIRDQAGLPHITEGQYTELERGYSSIFAATNMPKGFYDSLSDYTNLIANDWSVDEVNEGVQKVYNAVSEAPEPVRQYFNDAYGVYGDAAMASLLIDGDKALSSLETMARTAEIGGQSRMAGFGLGKYSAENLARAGISDFELRSSFDKVRQEQPLLANTYTDTRAFSDEDAINAALNQSPGTGEALNQRQAQRLAAFAPTGGSALTRQGFAGLGGAEQT